MRNNFEIITPRTRLVEFSEEFISSDYIAWLNDKDVIQYSRQRFQTHDAESCKRFLDSFTSTDNKFLAIALRENNQHIGNVTTCADMINGVCDLQIMIGEKSLWGQGYAREIWQALIFYVFDQGKIRMITGGTMATNTGMIKVMENSGMQPYYTRKEYFLDDGKKIDSLHYYCDKDTWKKK